MDLMKKQSRKLHMDIRLLTWSALSIALATGLSGCGGGSNNLADPTVSNNGSTLVSCSTSGTTVCVTGQFIVDAPVAGISYQCGTVNDITDSTGTVACPDQSVATFSLKSTDGTRSITLGTYLVKSNRDTGRNASQTLVSITPLDLVQTAQDAGTLTDSRAQPAVNIAQILETLRSTTSPYLPDSPTSRLVIDAATKAKLNLLTDNVTAANIANGDFVTKIQPVLTALNLSLVSTDETIARLSKALQAIQAGTYYSNPTFILNLPNSDFATVANIATVATATTVNDQAILALSTIIDRSGHAVGQGAEWNGSIVPLADAASGSPTWAYNLLSGPKGHTRLVLNSPNSFINPVNGFLNSNFSWLPQAFTLDPVSFAWVPPTTPSPLGNANFTNGRLLSGTYFVGNQTLWQNVTNNAATVTAPTNELATWKQDNNSTTNYYSGTLTLQKTRSIDPFLNPIVFKTASNVGVGNKGIFPLSAVLTFKYDDTACPSGGCLLGTQGITILANGNIVADMNKDCNASEPNPTPIGLVGAAFQGITNIADRFISPIIMLSGQQFGALDGIQIGTLSFSQSVKINVVGAQTGSINISDNTNVPSSDGTTIVTTGEQSTSPAKFTNFYDLWSALKNTYATGKKTVDDVALMNRSVGAVSIALNTSCYSPPIGH